jgi:hypothetical protein
MSRHRLAAAALVAGLTSLLTGTIVRDARADDVIEHGYRPNKPLIVSGFVTFGIPYTISVVVAATSARDADQALYIPLVGPWIDLATRGGCPALAAGCNDTAAKAGLVVDGIFQGLGVISMASGFLWRQQSYTTVHKAGIDWVSPWASGTGGGQTAMGHF